MSDSWFPCCKVSFITFYLPNAIAASHRYIRDCWMLLLLCPAQCSARSLWYTFYVQFRCYHINHTLHGFVMGLESSLFYRLGWFRRLTASESDRCVWGGRGDKFPLAIFTLSILLVIDAHHILWLPGTSSRAFVINCVVWRRLWEGVSLTWLSVRVVSKGSFSEGVWVQQ